MRRKVTGSEAPQTPRSWFDHLRRRIHRDFLQLAGYPFVDHPLLPCLLTSLQRSAYNHLTMAEDSNTRFLLDAIYYGGQGLQMDYKEVAKVYGITLPGNAYVPS